MKTLYSYTILGQDPGENHPQDLLPPLESGSFFSDDDEMAKVDARILLARRVLLDRRTGLVGPCDYVYIQVTDLNGVGLFYPLLCHKV